MVTPEGDTLRASKILALCSISEVGRVLLVFKVHGYVFYDLCMYVQRNIFFNGSIYKTKRV